MHEEIASQLVDADVDFFAGGGWKYFLERKDNRNLFHELREKGYEMDSLALPSQLDGSKKYGSLIAKKSMPSKYRAGRISFKELLLQPSNIFRKVINHIP